MMRLSPPVGAAIGTPVLQNLPESKAGTGINGSVVAFGVQAGKGRFLLRERKALDMIDC